MSALTKEAVAAMSDAELQAGVIEIFGIEEELPPDFDPVNVAAHAGQTLDIARGLDKAADDPRFFCRFAGALLDLMPLPFTPREKSGRRAICGAVLIAASSSN